MVKTSLNRTLARVVVAAVVVGLPLSQGRAQARDGARTPWGHPDLQGVWNFGTLTPLERPERWADKEVVSEQEAVAYVQSTLELRARSRFQTESPDWWPENQVLRNRRTSLIVDPPDGRIPALTPEARARRLGGGRAEGGQYDHPENLSLQNRCIAWPSMGPPMRPNVDNNNVLIVQTPDYVVLVTEMIHNARIVPLDGRPREASIPSMQGDPIGRWEGDTLVVETTNFDGRLSFNGSGRNLRLIERFNATSDDSLEYRFTMDDATTWTRPWTVQIDMSRSEGLMYEFACHEGNERILSAILSGARYQERQKKGAKTIAIALALVIAVTLVSFRLLGDEPTNQRPGLG